MQESLSFSTQSSSIGEIEFDDNAGLWQYIKSQRNNKENNFANLLSQGLKQPSFDVQVEAYTSKNLNESKVNDEAEQQQNLNSSKVKFEKRNLRVDLKRLRKSNNNKTLKKKLLLNQFAKNKLAINHFNPKCVSTPICRKLQLDVDDSSIINDTDPSSSIQKNKRYCTPLREESTNENDCTKDQNETNLSPISMELSLKRTTLKRNCDVDSALNIERYSGKEILVNNESITYIKENANQHKDFTPIPNTLEEVRNAEKNLMSDSILTVSETQQIKEEELQIGDTTKNLINEIISISSDEDEIRNSNIYDKTSNENYRKSDLQENTLLNNISPSKRKEMINENQNNFIPSTINTKSSVVNDIEENQVNNQQYLYESEERANSNKHKKTFKSRIPQRIIKANCFNVGSDPVLSIRNNNHTTDNGNDVNETLRFEFIPKRVQESLFKTPLVVMIDNGNRNNETTKSPHKSASNISVLPLPPPGFCDSFHLRDQSILKPNDKKINNCLILNGNKAENTIKNALLISDKENYNVHNLETNETLNCLITDDNSLITDDSEPYENIPNTPKHVRKRLKKHSATKQPNLPNQRKMSREAVGNNYNYKNCRRTCSLGSNRPKIHLQRNASENEISNYINEKDLPLVNIFREVEDCQSFTKLLNREDEGKFSTKSLNNNSTLPAPPSFLLENNSTFSSFRKSNKAFSDKSTVNTGFAKKRLSRYCKFQIENEKNEKRPSFIPLPNQNIDVSHHYNNNANELSDFQFPLPPPEAYDRPDEVIINIPEIEENAFEYEPYYTRRNSPPSKRIYDNKTDSSTSSTHIVDHLQEAKSRKATTSSLSPKISNTGLRLGNDNSNFVYDNPEEVSNIWKQSIKKKIEYEKENNIDLISKIKRKRNCKNNVDPVKESYINVTKNRSIASKILSNESNRRKLYSKGFSDCEREDNITESVNKNSSRNSIENEWTNSDTIFSNINKTSGKDSAKAICTIEDDDIAFKKPNVSAPKSHHTKGNKKSKSSYSNKNDSIKKNCNIQNDDFVFKKPALPAIEPDKKKVNNKKKSNDSINNNENDNKDGDSNINDNEVTSNHKRSSELSKLLQGVPRRFRDLVENNNEATTSLVRRSTRKPAPRGIYKYYENYAENFYIMPTLNEYKKLVRQAYIKAKKKPKTIENISDYGNETTKKSKHSKINKKVNPIASVNRESAVREIEEDNNNFEPNENYNENGMKQLSNEEPNHKKQSKKYSKQNNVIVPKKREDIGRQIEELNNYNVQSNANESESQPSENENKNQIQKSKEEKKKKKSKKNVRITAPKVMENLIREVDEHYNNEESNANENEIEHKSKEEQNYKKKSSNYSKKDKDREFESTLNISSANNIAVVSEVRGMELYNNYFEPNENAMKPISKEESNHKKQSKKYSKQNNVIVPKKREDIGRQIEELNNYNVESNANEREIIPNENENRNQIHKSKEEKNKKIKSKKNVRITAPKVMENMIREVDEHNNIEESSANENEIEHKSKEGQNNENKSRDYRKLDRDREFENISYISEIVDSLKESYNKFEATLLTMNNTAPKNNIIDTENKNYKKDNLNKKSSRNNHCEKNKNTNIVKRTNLVIDENRDSSSKSTASSQTIHSNISESLDLFHWVKKLATTTLKDKINSKKDNSTDSLERYFREDYFRITDISNMQVTEENGIQYSFYSEQQSKDFGYIKFKSGARKPKTRSKTFDLHFLFIFGILEFKIENNVYNSKAGNFVSIPKGTYYSMNNNSNETACLFFIKIGSEN